MEFRSFFLFPSSFLALIIVFALLSFTPSCFTGDSHLHLRYKRQSEKQRQLRILPDQKKASLEAHKTLVLTCQGENQDPGYFSDFQWFRKDGQLIESRDKYQLTSGEGALSLIIEDPTVSDRGVYTCTALFQKTVTLNASIEIDIYKGITWDDCEPEQYLIHGMNGQKVVCRISSLPTSKINWEKDGKPLDMNIYAISNDGILIKGKVDNDTAGSFKVKASMLDYGILRTRVIRVQIIVPPKINYLDPIKEVVEGEKATIDCKASGSPLPFYSFIDNQRRNLSLEFGYRVDKLNGILIIDAVRKESEDQYIECLVENSAGRDSKRIKLKVLTKPVVYEFKNESFPEGISASWVCSVRGNPLPKVEIVKMDHSSSLDRLDEKPIETIGSRFSYEIIKKGDEEVDYRLRINRVTRYDDGLYLCKANNSAGSTSTVGHIQVQYPPDLADTNTEIRTWGNNAVNLSCIAHAIPNATFFWRFNGQDIRVNDDVYSIVETVGSSHLQIRPNIGRYVYGTYSCRAYNTQGDRSVNINLKEAYPPSSPSINILRTRPTSLDIEITDVSSDLPVKNYRVKYWQDSVQMGDAKEIIWPAAGKVYKLTGLTPRTRYRLSFAAENDVGVSPYTSLKFHDTLTESRPEKTSLVLEETQEQQLVKDGYIRSEFGDRFRFRWHQAEDNGRMIDHYLIKYHKVRKTHDGYIVSGDDDAYQPIKVRASSSLEYFLTRLVPNTFYKLELFSVNSIGRSDPVDLVFRTSSDAASSSEWRPEGIHASQYNLGTALLSVAISLTIILIVMDIIFYIRCKVGVLYFLKSLFWSTELASTKAKPDEFPHSGNLGSITEVKRSSSKPEVDNLAFDSNNGKIRNDELTPMMSVDSRGNTLDSIRPGVVIRRPKDSAV